MKHIEFIQGPIASDSVQRLIETVSKRTDVGGIDLFIGNVRADKMEDSEVAAIEFTHELQLATNQLENIIDQVSQEHQCKAAMVLHSIGTVRVGEMCMAVVTGCKHRADAYDANRAIVERLKKEVPIWGKEIGTSDATQWKVNTQ